MEGKPPHQAPLPLEAAPAITSELPGNFEKAAETQPQALASPQFPPGYREQGTAQLQSYEKSLAEQRKVK